MDEKDAPEIVAQEETATATDLITMAQIAVTQLPIIEERLRDVKSAVESMVADAESLIATPDTIQAVKARRAELNKQFDTLDAQRRAVKEAVMAPYSNFEAVYKECIAGPFKRADAALKATIDGFEGELKAQALEKLEGFYWELCGLDGIDFLPFPDALKASGIKLTLADCRTKKPQKAMEAMAQFTAKIGLAMGDIAKMEDSAEILVEFKKSLDAGKAAATVAERKRMVKEAEEAEERRKAEEAARNEQVAKVEALRPEPVAPPTPVSAPDAPLKVPQCVSFKIYPKTAEEYQKILPTLRQLKEILIQEGIDYGK